MATVQQHQQDNISEVEAGKHQQPEMVEGADGEKQVAEERVVLTEADNQRIKRKTDKYILSILCWIYFLQIFDKVVFGLGNVFGLSTDLRLTSQQYSMAGSIHAIAQLAWQPFSSYIIVRVPARPLMTFLVFAWGLSAACMAAAKDYHGIYVTRFLLGLFEAGCLPLFSIITAQWYRRSEQPIRIACWYGTNGIASIVAGFLAYGFGHITNGALRPWQILYLFAGLITVLSAPLVWYFLDNDIQSARFFTEEEKKMATERLRANQTGTGAKEWNWSQALEVFIDPKSYLWLAIAMFPNIGAAVTNVFGPTLLRQFGFDIYILTLLTTPFGALQSIAIAIGCYCAYKFRLKSAILAALMLLVVGGCVMLYTQAVKSVADFQRNIALGGYYLLAFIFSANPLIVSWMIANTAGQTKKSVTMALFNAASAVGNIVGPLLFSKEEDKPYFAPGTRAVMGIFIALIGCIGIQVVLLFLFNKQRQRQRVAVGKPKFIHDTSMENKYQAYGEDEHASGLGQAALHDLSDVRNNEFVYVY